MPDDIKIINHQIKLDSKSQSILLCNMSDGSVWECDMQGNNWRKNVMSSDELTRKFRESMASVEAAKVSRTDPKKK